MAIKGTNYWLTYIEGVFQSVNRRRIKSTNDRDDSTEIVEFLKDDHYFKDARHNSDTFLKVFGLDNTFFQPESKLHT